MHLEWTSPAIKDLKNAGNFIAKDSSQAAKRMAGKVQDDIEYLLEYPNMGRPGRVSGTRELIISGTPFIVVYRVVISVIQILRVIHHARKWPIEE